MKNLIYIAIVSTLLFFTGCEDFLDEPKPTADVSSADVFSSEVGIRAYFNGTYRRIRQFNDGVGDDSEALSALLNTRTLKGQDFIRPDFNWFIFEYNFQDRSSANSRKTNLIWNMSYEIINSMNVMIDELQNSSIPEARKAEFTAEARAIRGYMYFQLIREYAKPITLNPGGPGVPIYTEPASAASTGNPRAPISDVYDVILEDLEFAKANIPDARPVKSQVNLDVVNGLLARVYLEMAQYPEAEDAANAARQGYSLEAGSYSDGFNDLSSPEWMWGMPQRNDQTIYYGSFASFWDGTRYSPIHANPTLVDLFSATDVRNLFTVSPTFPSLYRTSKFVADADFGEDVVLMRVAEMYLIEAEAIARQGGRDAEAAELLFELQSDRDQFAAESGNTGQNLINEILVERRKELYAEGLADYMDLKRLQMPLVRDVNHPAAYRFNYPANSDNFLYLIPRTEIDANPAISDDDQNG